MIKLPEGDKTIQKVMETIDTSIKMSFDEALLLNNLAQIIGYSKFHATRYFKKLTGITFREYISLRRLTFSAIELKETDESILNIAIKYGFSSQEAFTRAFKRTYNITPKIYRKSPFSLPSHIDFPTEF